MQSQCFHSCHFTCGTAKDPLSFFTNARASENNKEGGEEEEDKGVCRSME